VHTVFISYASADKPIAERVCSALERGGLACWIAPRNIEPGADFAAEIIEAIHSARAVVLVLTPAAMASPHILSEIGHAFSGKKRILPFRLCSDALPADFDYFLSMTQWLDALDGCNDASLDRLLRAMRDVVAGNAAIAHVTEPPRKRKLPLFAAIALAAVFVAGGLFYWLRPVRETPKEAVAAPSEPPPPPVISGPKTRVNPKDGQTYVWIPPGSFTMGCSPGDSDCRDNERPAHRVDIEKGFWLCQHEVTKDRDLPVTGVTWAGAKAYCAARGGRLPTEAEWEYAARAGRPEPYYGVLPDIAWYSKNSNGGPRPVGSKKPNAFGLYDMLGNVSEWVRDRYYNKYYPDAVATGAVDEPLAPNATAVARGGFWDADAAAVRVSRRSEMPNDEGAPTVGFRCASDGP
jgi:formylglycine-generating enzyme required for sulfatase activity